MRDAHPAGCGQVLYNTALLAQYNAASYMSAVWNSATYGSAPVSPVSLAMQQVKTCDACKLFALRGLARRRPCVCSSARLTAALMRPAQDCNLVLLSAANAQIYSSSTSGDGAACALTVSGRGGGLITVSSSNSTVLYVQPSSFQILFEGQNYAFLDCEPGLRPCHLSKSSR